MKLAPKYEPLFEHLLYSGKGQLSLEFSEIERLLGKTLPPSARQRPEWWSNSTRGHSQAVAWLRAGYRTGNLDLAGERVEFTLEGWPEDYVKASFPLGLGEGRQPEYAPKSQDGAEPSHPLRGIWKGKVTLLPDYDYTQPIFTEWASDDAT